MDNPGYPLCIFFEMERNEIEEEEALTYSKSESEGRMVIHDDKGLKRLTGMFRTRKPE